MKRLVEFPSQSSGEPVVVEAQDLESQGETRRGLSTSAVVEGAQTSFEDALDKAQPIASGSISRLYSPSEALDKVQVEFGLGLSANAGAVLVAGASAARWPTARLGGALAYV